MAENWNPHRFWNVQIDKCKTTNQKKGPDRPHSLLWIQNQVTVHELECISIYINKYIIHIYILYDNSQEYPPKILDLLLPRTSSEPDRAQLTRSMCSSILHLLPSGRIFEHGRDPVDIRDPGDPGSSEEQQWDDVPAGYFTYLWKIVGL